MNNPFETVTINCAVVLNDVEVYTRITVASYPYNESPEYREIVAEDLRWELARRILDRFPPIITVK